MAIFPEEGRRHAVIHFYESIKNLRGCKTKPLFWLQYAIACLVLEELFRAETYFKTAYSFVNHRDFDPYQIDNHYARFLLINAIKNKKSDEAMKFFRRAQTIINRQLKTERRHYPYRVAILYQGFLERFYIELAGSDIEWIQRAAAYVLKKEKDLPDFRKRHKYIKQCKRAMEDIVDRTNEILEDRKITEDLEAGQEDENEE